MGLFIFSCILGIAFVITLLLKRFNTDPSSKTALAVVATILFLASATTFVFSTTKSVSNGHIAVGSLFGDVKEVSLDGGMHWPVNPLMSWTERNVQLQTTEFAGRDHFQCLSKDNKEFFLEANVSWMEIPKHAAWTQRNIKDGAALIAGAQRTGLRLAGGQYDLMDLSSHFEELENLAVVKSNEALVQNLKAYGAEFTPFVITKVDIRRPELPESIQAAITAKLQKQQESEGMAFVITKERQEAERKSIEARGIADFQKIVSEGISERLLAWKYIETMEKLAASNNTTFVFAPDGRTMPFQFTKPVDSIPVSTTPGK